MATIQPSWHASSCLEKVLEHRFVAELTSALWLQGVTDFEVLRSEVDSHGYDLVIEAGGVLRHIQLKDMVQGGKRRDVSINFRLAGKPSGCIIWFTYNPQTLTLGPFHWFGGLPGEPLPDVGTPPAKHTKGTSLGAKNVRPCHREVARTRFRAVAYVGELVDLLFGTAPEAADGRGSGAHAVNFLRRNIADAVVPERPAWLPAVRAGDFTAIPQDLKWDNSVEFAHLIEGYELVDRLGLGNPFKLAERQLKAATKSGHWSGDAAQLWVALFLEHRRWRTSTFDPGPEMTALLDRLCQQVRQSLIAR